MSKKVFIAESAIIKASAEKIFDYITDGNNDSYWRTEVDRMDVQGAIQVGTILVEYSSFYRFLHTVTPTVIKALERPYKIILETPSTHSTWLQSVRTVRSSINGGSTVTYELAFTLDSMKQIMPFVPPAELVTMWYRPRIKKYLKNLKTILEQPEIFL